jgi:hypothetical protein
VTALEDRQPIVVADAGPLIRLAAAGLLGSLRGLNRRIVLVDRLEDEVAGDSSKPYAQEIANWIAEMGDAILRAQTVTGVGIEALRRRHRTAEEDRLLKSTLRNSGELALREFVENWRPSDVSSALVLYEDRKVAALFLEADFPLTLMTTRAFARTLVSWGVNANAVDALENVAGQYDLKPALVGEVDAEIPTDQRPLPQPML